MIDNFAIRVDHVSKTFNLPHEKQSSLKGMLISKLKGSNRSYEKQEVLKDVTFDIGKGQFFAIVGRNGSGKSTLLKMLAGIYSPTLGSITIQGKLTPFIELGVGFNPELTGRENVFLNGALLGFSRREMEQMYDDIVTFAELSKFMDQRLKNYSSGMQVRLAFSIAIRAQTDILLLDEVLAVGDAAFQQKCFNYFEELRAKKKTVVFVSHDMDAVRRFCTNAVYIKDGNLIHNGTPNEVADIYLEENMQSTIQANVTHEEVSTKHTLTADIVDRSDTSVSIRFAYTSTENESMYLGISVIRDGISFAEMNTSEAPPLKGSGYATYRLDITNLNSGMYNIGAGLFRFKNGELLSINSNQASFLVKGADHTRGGSLKLPNTWKYE